MLQGDSIGRLGDLFADLEERGRAEFAAEGIEGTAHRTVDVRYRRQGYELNVAWDEQAPERTVEAFHQLHRRHYGFSDGGRPIEIVNLRLRMVAAGEPYEPERTEPVPGDGAAAFFAERPVFFHDASSDGRFFPARFYRRDRLRPGDVVHGPAMITEYTAATVVPPESSAQVDCFGNLVISVIEEAHT